MRSLILIVAIVFAGAATFAQGKGGNKGGNKGNNKTGVVQKKNQGNKGPGKNGGIINTKPGKGNGNKITILPGKNKGNGNSGKNKPGNSTTVYGHPNKNGNGKPQGMSGYEHGKATSTYNKNKHKIPQTQGVALREIVLARERTNVLFDIHRTKLSTLRDALERRRRLGTISEIEYKRKKSSISLLEQRHKTLRKRLRP